MVRDEVIAPFSYHGSLEASHGRNIQQTFSGYTFQCIAIERDSGGVLAPTQCCFEPNSSILRYKQEFDWYQTVYNRVVPFQQRSLAQEVEVTIGGKPYLKLRVETIEFISKVEEASFAPPSDAVGPLGGGISGVSPVPIKGSVPQWPRSLRGQHFTVTVEIVIGTNGHVVSARGVIGPAEGYKACEDAVRKWVFRPYLVLDKPVEIEENVKCRGN
jgi:hypothetical protein